MPHHFLRAATWAVTLGTLSMLTTVGDPPTDGERALLGRVPTPVPGNSNLRLAGRHGQVSAERALLGRLTATDVGAGAVIQIRPRTVDGESALLGRP